MGSLLIRLTCLLVTLLLAATGPSFAGTVTIPVAEDAWVWSAVPANNIGTTGALEIGRTVPKSGQPVNRKRALLHFDIAGVPADMVVTAAALRLYVTVTYTGDPLNLGLTARRLSSPFVEGDMSSGVTWDTQPTVESAPIDTATMNTVAGQWFEMDVTDVVAAEYASADPTNVWLQVAPSDETTIEDRYVAVRSRENGNPDYVPQLVITYASPTPTFTPTPLPPPTSTATATSTPTPTGLLLPPDPATVAPALDLSVASDIFASTEFLYVDDPAIQSGVAPGVIEVERASLLRGTVRRSDGSPLPGVTITVLSHPELGSTLSRADGVFDLVVNGGGPLVVQYRDQVADATDYIPVDRQIDVAWQRTVWLPDVVMTPYDVATTIQFPASTMVAALGSVVADVDGARRATILFRANTAATFVDASGIETPYDGPLSIRATEYSVGSSGPAAMPAALPPESAYTYCVELSADQALQAGAAHVRFDPAAIFYVQNFLDFPVGEPVPTGYYDRAIGTWIAADNGRVIRLVAESNGLAQLDTDGAGNDGGLALGVDDAERQQLADRYEPGQELWRVVVPHFTPWDHNWGMGPPEDAAEPDAELDDLDDEDDSCRAVGSIIGCENQTLGESVPIMGTPFQLSYASDRVRGRTRDRTRRIRLTGAVVPASLKRVELQVTIAGRVFRQTFADDPNNPSQTIPAQLATSFTWDGMDAYNRRLQGAQPLTVAVGYVYDGVYYAARSDFDRAFARVSGVPVTGSRARAEITLWRYLEDALQAWDAGGLGLGGWNVDVHHAFDPTGRTVRFGAGARRSGASMPRALQIVAGGGNQGDGDGGLATSARLPYPGDVAVAPDGTLYVAENGHDFNVVRLRKVSRDGVITTAAGSYDGGIGYSGDGDPATQAQFGGITGVDLGPDGSIYLADQSNFRVRRVDAAGTIMTVAGTGQYGANGDGGPAVQADLIPVDVAAAPDGSLYIATRDEMGSHRIRRLSPEGMIYTVAGGGLSSDDGILATDAFIYGVSSVDIAPDGSIYFAENYVYHRIRRVGVDGRVTTIAGGLGQGFSGDGGPAAAAFLSNPFQLAVARDGSVYVADADNDRVRRVASDGIITTVAGGGNLTEADGPAIGAYLGTPYGIAVGQDGEILVAENFNWQVRRIAVPFDGVTGERRLIASADGNEVFEFDAGGRHRFTYHALTGQVLLSFGYAGPRLATIADGDGNVTSISYGASSAVIEAPFHQQTTLTFGANGYLASVNNPAGETIEVTHDADGLLQTFEDARDHAWQFTYDSSGRLERDDDPAGGFQTLARTSIANGYQVDRTTAEGRSTIYAVERLPGGERVRRVTSPDGTVSETTTGPDGQHLQTLADQTERQLREGPDPRFGLQASIASGTEETTPLGRIRSTSALREAIRANPSDPLSLLTQTDWLSINGRIPIVSEFTAGTPALRTTTSSMGRVSVEELDGQGRLTKRSLTGLHPIRYSYDARGRLSTIAHGPDPDPNGDARFTTFAYKETVDPNDPQNGYLDVVTDAEDRTVQFTYDAAGRPLVQTFEPGTAHERVVEYDYDDNGNLTGVTPPGRPRHDFAYTPVNLEEAYTPPLLPSVQQPQTTYGYDLDRNLTSVLHPGGGSVAYTLDPDSGQLDPLVVQPENETRAYTYDPTSGYTASVSTPDALLSFGYDADLLTSETWTFTAPAVTHTVTHGYDNDFRRQSIQVDALPAVSFLYDDDGLLIAAGDLTLDRDADNGLLRGTTLVGGVTITDTYTPSPFGEVDAYSAAVDGTPIYGYTIDQRDKLGRIVRKTETIEGASTQYEYGYDPAGRLADVWRLSPSPTHLAHYEYDANGNRIGGFNQVSDTIVPVSGSDGTRYDAQDRLEQYETTAGGLVTYAYTGDGALQTKSDLGGTTTYDYDAFGNLRTVDLPGGTTLTYLVDGRNRRIGTRVNDGTQNQFVQGFLYHDQLEPIAELGSDGGVVAQFVYASKPHVPDYVIKYGAGAGVYRIVSDHLGSPRLVVDLANGTVMQRIDYDEFGNVTENTNPGFQPFGFVGGIWACDLNPCSEGGGLTRFGARDYDPQVGRWTTKDPIGFLARSANLYAYVFNDAINSVDVSGLEEDTVSKDVQKAIAEGRPSELETVLDGAGNTLPSALRDLANAAIKRFRSTAQDILSRECKGSAKNEFPGEYLNKTLEEIWKLAREGARAAQKAKKILSDQRFKKGS